MKKGNDSVRVPTHMRSMRNNGSRLSSESVGDSLRRARTHLVLKWLIVLVTFILLAVFIFVFAYFGYSDKLIQYFVDRLV